VRLLLATTNRGKLREIHQLLTGLPIELLSLADFPPVPEPDETGATFRDNAILKARYYGGHARRLTVAEDSGLVVDALGGEPGVRSARFVRADASYEERFAEIERRLALAPAAPRTARFVCALAVVHGSADGSVDGGVDGGGVLFEATGVVEGEIATVASGKGGFGYDPIFFYPPYRATLAEVSQEEKLRVAHRGQAFRKLRQWLEEQAAVET
jgi:XTP/dITP diphosphohydrolase